VFCVKDKSGIFCAFSLSHKEKAYSLTQLQ
jgi:hypothetical protein